MKLYPYLYFSNLHEILRVRKREVLRLNTHSVPSDSYGMILKLFLLHLSYAFADPLLPEQLLHCYNCPWIFSLNIDIGNMGQNACNKTYLFKIKCFSFCVLLFLVVFIGTSL